MLNLSGSEFTGNSAKLGGAIEDQGIALTIGSSTFDHNRASSRGGALDLLTGGAVIDTTITDNTVAGDGGGVDFEGSAGFSLSLFGVTIDGNTATGSGGGLALNVSSASAMDTIIAGDTAGGVANDLTNANGATYGDVGGNLLGTTAGVTGTVAPGILIADPKLGPLMDNGGLTAGAPTDGRIVPTQALLPGSPAVGRGIAALAAEKVDERGFSRPGGGAAKSAIGAYEPQYAANATPDQVFTENLYEVLLNRPAEPAGLAGGANFLAAGGTPTGLVQLLQTTTEYLDDQVTLLYRRYLGRSPSAFEVGAVAGVLKSGATPEQMSTSLIGTPEFFSDFGSANDVFVEGAFRATLGRAPASPAELAAWDNLLAAGTTRPAAATLLLTTSEYLSDLIVSDFLAYLGRNPSAADMAAFLASAKGGVSSTNLAAIALGASFAART